MRHLAATRIALLLLVFSSPSFAATEFVEVTPTDQSEVDRVALFGDRMLARRLDGTMAYVFRREPTGWVQEASFAESICSFTGNSGVPGFSGGVALSDDVALLGSPLENPSFQGEVCVLRRVGETWSFEASLLVSGSTTAGSTLRFLGDAALSLGRGVAATVQGQCGGYGMEVEHWLPSGTRWGHQQTVSFSGAQPWGQDLAAWDDRFVVGNPPACSEPPRAHVYRRDGGAWIEEQVLVGAGGEFGDAVAITGDWLLVGDPQETPDQGTVRVFQRSGTTWSETGQLTPSGAGDFEFGTELALEGDRAWIGSVGAVYAVQRVGSAWIEIERITIPAAQDHFYAVTVQAGRLALTVDGSIHVAELTAAGVPTLGPVAVGVLVALLAVALAGRRARSA